MSNIIIPSKYAFLSPDSRSLDAEVDELTRTFDSDASLREVVTEHNIYPEVTASWRDIGFAVFHGRRTNCLLLVVDQAMKYVADYEEPVLWTPDNAENEQRVRLRETWFSSPILQKHVADYRKALQDAYFEFCKQFMNHFTAGFKQNPSPVHSKNYDKWQKAIKRHPAEAHNDCDRSYYSEACRLLKQAEEKGTELSKALVGRFFVISPEEMTALMAIASQSNPYS